MLEETAPSNPDRIYPGKSLESQSPISRPPSTFESYMQGETKGASQFPPRGASLSPTGQVTPTPQMQTAGPTVETLLAQSKNVQDGLGLVSQQLNTPNLKLKRSQNHLLKTKLQDANEAIRDSAAKLGLQNPEMKFPSTPSPLGRFLAYVGDGQDRLTAVQNELKSLSNVSGGVSPAKILFMQVKINQAQQEISYATTLLGKVIDTLKTILNTQL